MKRTLLYASFICGFSGFLPGQVTPNTPGQAAPDALKVQSWTGVLMDASCAAITANQSGALTSSAQTAKPPVGITSHVGTSSAKPPSDAAPPEIPPVATAIPGAPANPKPTTSASAAHDLGTDGTVGRSRTAATTNTAPPAAATTGERSRTAETATNLIDPQFATVQETYRDCMVRPTSSAFALHTDGRVVMLDEASNQMVRKQLGTEQFRMMMSNASGSPQWMNVTVNGSMAGDRLKTTSISK